MTVKSYTLLHARRDLSGALSTAVAGQPRFISLFIAAAAARATKHEWLEDQIKGRGFTMAGLDTGTYTVSAADGAKLKVGTLFIIDSDTALFKVATKPTDVTFTVTRVATNGSVTAAPANNSVCHIVAFPVQEASGNGDGEQTHRSVGKNYNFTQILRKEIIISGTALAVDTFDNVDANINRQTEFAMTEAARDMNRIAIFGKRIEASDIAISAAGGLYDFGTAAGALLIDANGNIFDSFMVNDAAQIIIDAGGNPDVILCAPGQARVLSGEFKDRLQIIRADTGRGAYVAEVRNEMTGGTMRIISDPDFIDSEPWVVDSASFGLSQLNGRALADKDATPNDFDGIKRLALGEFTFEFKNAGQRLCRIKGVKSSALSLAALKAKASESVAATLDGLPEAMEALSGLPAAMGTLGEALTALNETLTSSASSSSSSST